MAILLLLSVSTWGSSTDSPVSIGDYIVLYAQLKDCPEFPGIIDARKVDDSDQFFGNAGPIEVLGSTSAEIQAKLVAWITRASPSQQPPRTLRIEVLRSEQEYQMIREQLLASKKFLAYGTCVPPKPPREPAYEIDPDWHRIAGTPNQSMRRFVKPITWEPPSQAHSGVTARY